MSIIFGLRKPFGDTVEKEDMLMLGAATEAYAPDGVFVRAAGCFGMGFQPYYTTDRGRLETQPIEDRRGNIIAFDGRLDNYADLCRDLGIENTSPGDSSIVLAAFERWGERCFSNLIGDWATALYSASQHKLVKDDQFIAHPAIAEPGQLQLALRFDHLRHQLGRRGKAHPFALPAGRNRQCDGQVALACACFTDQHDGFLALQILALAQLFYLGHGDLRRCRKIELLQCLDRREVSLLAVVTVARLDCRQWPPCDLPRREPGASGDAAHCTDMRACDYSPHFVSRTGPHSTGD